MEVIDTTLIQEIAQDPNEKIRIDRTADIAFGERISGATETVITLAPRHQMQIASIAMQSMHCFRQENTFVEKKQSTPTMLARVDCTLDKNGIVPFECDERPAGIGITSKLMRRATGMQWQLKIIEHLILQSGDLPVVVRHPDAAENDDSDAFKVYTLGTDDFPIDQPILARGEPKDFLGGDPNDVAMLQEKSIATITCEGDKTYALKLPVFRAQIASLSALAEVDGSFTLKPVQGSKARGIGVFLSAEDRQCHGKARTITRSRAERMVSEAPDGSLILERFKAPILTEDSAGKRGNMILRVFTLVRAQDDCEVIGGTFITRPELVVHGATNAVSGAVVI